MHSQLLLINFYLLKKTTTTNCIENEINNDNNKKINSQGKTTNLINFLCPPHSSIKINIYLCVEI